MYTILFILFLAIATFLISKGIKTHKKFLTLLGTITGALTILFSWFLGFWGEQLWFDQLGYNERFWTVWLTKIGLFLGSFLISALYIFLLTFSLKTKKQRIIRYIAMLLGAVFCGIWLVDNWEVILLFTNKITTNIYDPILGMQTGFYLFTYPFLKTMYSSFLFLSILAFVASLLANFEFDLEGNSTNFSLRDDISKNKSLFISTAVILLILAFRIYLNRYGLLFSENGIVNGPGWTDEHIRLPILLFMSVLTTIVAIIMIIPAARNWLTGLFLSKEQAYKPAGIILIPGILFSIWFIMLTIVPSLFQWLKVEPNEITVERKYIENNIKFTRYGYRLDNVEERQFPVSENFPVQELNSNKNLLNNIRLWDYRALDAVFKQFQEIRLYYEFTDVDIDRYLIDSSYSQVMISAREMETGNLPLESQTFVNKRFKYTHGYGITLNRVNEFTEKGLPNLLIKDIPPVSKYKELEVIRPEIYYGELTKEYVIVNSKEQEFNYPSGENNIYTSYKGTGGVQLSNLGRKFLYGSQYGGTRLLLSGYASKKSRIMLHRQIADRIKTLAPFLSFDNDPYIVLNKGKLYWIIDAYTSSQYYPYSEPFYSLKRSQYNLMNSKPNSSNWMSGYLGKENYIRNSVKVTVDAYSGEVNLYVFEDEDPIIMAYKKIFPDLLKAESEMPQGLKDHVRYPIDMLQIQGLVYSKYHMTNPAVFYNQEDLWVRATEKYYSNVQPVEPYYIMWKQPGNDKIEFALVLPFTPKDKQVMIGWIAGLCDGDNYGRFLAYKFPKEKRILGPQQMETKIDQDSYLSGQLTLWDQRGSSVIRGNLLAIPIDGTVLYVEPIFLQSETSAYPELRLVAVMQDDNLSYAETFDEALTKLFQDTDWKGKEEVTTSEEKVTNRKLIERANNAFENYLEFMQKKEFRKAGEALDNLQQSLKSLNEDKLEK